MHDQQSVNRRQLNKMASASAGWVLVLLTLQACQVCQGTITVNEIEEDVFEVFVSGIKIFQHNKSSPMLYMGQGQTEFQQSGGYFHVQDHLSSRIPLPYAIIYSAEHPFDIELYIDYYHYLRFELHEDDQHALALRVTDFAGHVDRLWLRMVADPGERVYGGGEQFSHLDLRGRSFPVWSREQGVGRNKSTLTTFLADQERGGEGGDYHTTYFPQPTYISTRGYYLHHDGPDYAILDFSQPGFHELCVMAERSNISRGRVLIQNGSDATDLVRHLSDFLGRQPPLPKWIHDGAILGLQGGTKKVRDSVTRAEEYRVAISGVWMMDWSGALTTSVGQKSFWNWQWNETHYPGLPTLISDLQRKGIRALGYVNPHLHTEAPLFAVAEEHGYFVKDSSNQTFLSDFGEFYGGTIDLTNPDAFKWYKNEVIRRNMIDLGLGGWMADLGEYLPAREVLFHSGQTGGELHNQWPVLWARLNREAVEEAGKLGEVVFWMRSGFSGSGNHSLLMWAGDQNVDWSLSDGLPSTLTASLSLAMSGLTLTHFDIGGFTTFASYTPPLVRSEELLLRSAEMAVFSPVFRTHEGSQPWANVQYYSSRGTLLKFARLSRMFAAIKNYTSHVVTTSSQTGLPAQRPLFLNYPADQACYDIRYQYLYGDALLVAPVLQPDVTSHQVYLPEDPETPWVFLWDESMIVMGGRTVTVAAPLGQIPVFYRSVSPFASLFRAAASEPLVNAPAYVPKVPEPGRDPGCEVPHGGNGGASARPGFGCVLLLWVVAKIVLV
ncbi:hypothetical protein ACOMHN_021586 [Nucella lapillus]